MRQWVLGVWALVGTTAAAQGGPFVYAPGTQHFRLTTVVNRTQDQSGGRAPFEFSVTTTQYVTLTLSKKSPDTLAMEVAMDSMQVSSTLDAMPPDTEGFKGVKLRGALSPQGRIYVFEPPAGTTPGKVTALYRAFKLFLVPFPSSPMAAGLTWSDSSTEVIHRPPFDSLSTVTTTNWKVAGDTTIGGQHSWRVEREGEVTATGQGTEQGNPISYESDATIRGARYFSVSGMYLGGTATQNVQTQMQMTEAEGAPIRQTIKSTIELVGR